MAKIFSQKLFSLIPFGLMAIPSFCLAMTVYPSYNWPVIILWSLLLFLIIFVGWMISPLGIIFILASLFQFLFPKKAVFIVAWIFQGAVFVISILIGTIGLIYSLSQYGEGKYILFSSLIGATIVICCLMVGTMIFQIIWQIKKSKSGPTKRY